MSSRTAKARELIHNQNIVEVLNLWDNEDDVLTISEKTGLSTREVDMILISHEATKALKGIKTEPEFVLFPNEVLLDKSEIVAVVKKVQIETEDYSPLSSYVLPTIRRALKGKNGVNIIFRNGHEILLENMDFKEVLKKLNLEEK